eukprot:TRINITY_DN7099_c0_g1_i1.p1 TRINITY_DN7099_c0_g1~~TRINITY_DN7099_c0_g1_i1.p1  ORF type:complete len:354 (-),score=93.12 TRINITY_DN7099_c0_g1_i1:60-1088(-)
MEQVGNTPLRLISSLSSLTGNNIYLKCENLNLSGSVKDRAAKQMLLDALSTGKLKKGVKVVEGTAGNTGIGLAKVGKELGIDVVVVMPNDQAEEKMRLVKEAGGELMLVPAVPFSNENHFFHTAARLAKEKPEEYWHANQFHNLSNMEAHYNNTAPEIFKQLNEKVDIFVSSAGTAGTISGCSKYFKEKLKDKIITALVDPQGSGLSNYINKNELVASEGKSITEGIGIMRLVPNFVEGRKYIDEAFTIPDSHLVVVAHWLKENEGICLGSSAALNVCGALKKSLEFKGQGKNIVTVWCDGGERSASKLYNPAFLAERSLTPNTLPSIQDIIKVYQESNHQS